MIFKHRFYALLFHPLIFLLRVLRRFQANQRTLLAGAIAYNALLSLILLAILLRVALSHFVNEAQLSAMLQHYLEQLAPGKYGLIVNQVRQFLGH